MDDRTKTPLTVQRIHEVMRVSGLLRDYVNEPRTRVQLEGCDAFWQAASALDVLGDTAEALASFARRPTSDPDDVGDWYLRIYGILNAFTLQQDAGTELARALGFKPTSHDYASLREARDVRIKAAGHPTSRTNDGSGTTKHYFIYRGNGGAAGFTMAEATENDDYQTFVVNLEYLVYAHTGGMMKFLSDILGASEEEKMQHYDKFDDSLAAILAGKSYEFEKISTTGLGSGQPDTVMAPAAVKILTETLAKFETALEDRGLTVKSLLGIQGVWPQLSGPLAKLDAYFAAPSDSHLDALEAYALAQLVELSWNELASMAAELDDEYGTK